jgi:hypothetical protein
MLMRPPEELGDVDWAAYEGGSAVPPLIKMLYVDYDSFAGNEFYELESHIYNLGTVYPATVLAVPFLAHAALYAEHFPGPALTLLSHIAEMSGGPRGLGSEVLDAVVAEAVNLLPCLHLADPNLRRQALYLFGGCARHLSAERARVAAAVSEVFDNEMDRDIAADALTALELLEDEATFIGRVEQALSESDPVIRLTGILCALEVGYFRDLEERAELVDEAAKLAVKFTESGPPMYFPVLGSRQERARNAFRALQAASRDAM